MTSNDDQRPAEPTLSEPDSESTSDSGIPRGIARFARYTSPIMLAMLASIGKDRAFAAS